MRKGTDQLTVLVCSKSKHRPQHFGVRDLTEKLSKNNYRIRREFMNHGADWVARETIRRQGSSAESRFRFYDSYISEKQKEKEVVKEGTLREKKSMTGEYLGPGGTQECR